MRLRALGLCLVLAAAPLQHCGASEGDAKPGPSVDTPPRSAETKGARTPASLAQMLDAARSAHTIPALAAVATRADAVLEIAASGIRRDGRPDPVTAEDLFHLGSNTKAMTATLIGILVEEGKLSWTTTPLDVFPEWKDTVLPAYQDITITDLLSHHAGLSGYEDSDSAEFRDVKGLAGSPLEQRIEFARRALHRKPAVTPRTTFRYSNGGYSVAAAMAERAGGGAYEAQIQARLFGPLGIHPVAGWPAFADPRQPWGHTETRRGVKPHDPHDKYQLGPPFVPAGGLSASPGDYARFLQLHLRGLEGRDGLLKAETIRRLHTRVDDKVALGWGVVELEGALASVHSGSAGTFYAVVALWPSRDLGVAVFANAGGTRAAEACKEILKAMAHRYDPS